MEKNILRQVIADQRQQFLDKWGGLIDRDIDITPFLKGKEIVVITGIRRCGKSSFLRLIAKAVQPRPFFYLNFEDIRLSAFTPTDFTLLTEIIYEMYSTPTDAMYLFDEPQHAPFWERWVNNLYEIGMKIVLTGSNAQLISSEIATFLTGRNKVLQLTPFTFKELLRLKQISYNTKEMTTKQKALLLNTFRQYLEQGGFPLVVLQEDMSLVRQYVEDIVTKDIIVRYSIREIKEFKDLVIFLASNVGKVFSYSTLHRVTSIKSFSTLKNYVSYLENVFLFHQLGRFDYSLKKQKVSSSKIYALDIAIPPNIGFFVSEERGRLLENLVFIELKQRYAEIFYHRSNKECDFVVKEKLRITQAIQVTHNFFLTRERELSGLVEAMQAYKLKDGLILTLEEETNFSHKGYMIKVRPVWKWLLDREDDP